MFSAVWILPVLTDEPDTGVSERVSGCWTWENASLSGSLVFTDTLPLFASGAVKRVVQLSDVTLRRDVGVDVTLSSWCLIIIGIQIC